MNCRARKSFGSKALTLAGPPQNLAEALRMVAEAMPDLDCYFDGEARPSSPTRQHFAGVCEAFAPMRKSILGFKISWAGSQLESLARTLSKALVSCYRSPRRKTCCHSQVLHCRVILRVQGLPPILGVQGLPPPKP